MNTQPVLFFDVQQFAELLAGTSSTRVGWRLRRYLGGPLVERLPLVALVPAEGGAVSSEVLDEVLEIVDSVFGPRLYGRLDITLEGGAEALCAFADEVGVDLGASLFVGDDAHLAAFLFRAGVGPRQAPSAHETPERVRCHTPVQLDVVA